MRYVAAVLMLALGGNDNPSAADVKKVLGAVGIDAEDDKLNAVISACSGKSIEEIIAAGAEKMASVPSGGVGGGSAGGSGGAGAADDAAAEEEEKSESESDDDMGFSLFG